MCGGEGNESGFRWSLHEEENWFHLPDVKRRRSLCICNRLSETHSEHGRLTVTLKALRQSSLLGCTTCQGLLSGIRGILVASPRKDRRDSFGLSSEEIPQDRERHIDELVLSYQVDPNFECPLSPGGWNLRCCCNRPSCPHQKYYLDFEVLTPHDAGTIIEEFPTRKASLINSKTTGSSDALGFISRSIAYCDASHTQTCTRLSGGPMVPTRLLEVSNDYIRLVEPDPSVELRYVCLAHRWASRQPWDDEEDTTSTYSVSMRCRTLRSNLDKRKAHIVLEDLLPTYQDAISVTRRLGLSHIWIDSLCIVQDDEEDVRMQIARMGNIYGNSYVTIAGDTFKDHTQNFFSNRNWRWRAHEQSVVDSHGSSHKLFFRERPTHSHLGWDGLFDRAWCFQERLLSPRIVRFQADEIIFECNQGLICECGHPPAGHQGPWEDINKSAHLHDKVAFSALLAPDSKLSMSGSWHHLVHAYSKTHLTRESDRMDAFAGIVSLYHERAMSGSQYLAGLWSHSLWSDLLWSVTTNNSQLSNDISLNSGHVPSWSWMSIALGNHAIVYSKFKVQQTFPRLSKIHYQPLSINLPLGDVATGAYLEIEGQLTRIPAAHFLGTCNNSPNSMSLAANAVWDSKVLGYRNEDSLFLLKMAYLHQEPVVKEVFLILEPLRHLMDVEEEDVVSFRRVGYLEMAKDELRFSDEHALRLSEDYQTIRLY